MSLIRITIQKKLLNVCIGGMCLLQTVNAQDKLYPNAIDLQDVHGGFLEGVDRWSYCKQHQSP